MTTTERFLQPTSGPPASPVRLARMAGLLYLVVAILGAFVQVVRVNLYAPGDISLGHCSSRRRPPTSPLWERTAPTRWSCS